MSLWDWFTADDYSDRLRRAKMAERIGAARVALAREQDWLNDRLDPRSRAYIQNLKEKIINGTPGRASTKGDPSPGRTKPTLVRQGSASPVREDSERVYPTGWSFGRIGRQRDSRPTEARRAGRLG